MSHQYRVFIIRYAASKFKKFIMESQQQPEDLLKVSSKKSIEEKGSQQTSKEECSKQEHKHQKRPHSPIKHIHPKFSSFTEVPLFRSRSAIMDNFQRIMVNNKIWADTMVDLDPEFFNSLVHIQQPEYLWIGCSDSRVPANQICGLKAGEIFVHRNIANQAPPSDINVLAVVQYAVQVLKVTDIMVTGHYGCGGIKAAFKLHDHGALESWLSYIRDLRWRYHKQLVLPTQQENQNLLCEINVKQQVYNIARFPIVQKAWQNGQALRIHGLVYNLRDGLLHDLGITLHRLDHLPKQFRIFE